MKIKHLLTPLESRVEESHNTIFCQTLKTFKQVKESIVHTEHEKRNQVTVIKKNSITKL